MEQTFEERLKTLRVKYLENFPQDEKAQKAQLEAFKAMSQEEKEAKIQVALKLLFDKKSLLLEKLDQLQKEQTEVATLDEINTHIEAVTEKIAFFEEKLKRVQLNEEILDSSKKEKLKKQLAALELKRCRIQLDNKSCQKIDEKIAHIKEQYMKKLA